MFHFKTAALGVPALFICLATVAPPAYSQSQLPVATIGAQVLGRVRIQPDFSVKLYGYFTYLAGVNGPVFAGAPSENTAMFTYSADPTAASLLRNGDITQGLENPVNGQYTLLTVYYNPNPTGRNILNPDDFTQGQRIATFRSRAAAVNVAGSGSFQATAGLSLDTSSLFFFNNQPLNFFNLTSGLNLTLFGPAPSFDSITAGLLNDGAASLVYAGTAYTAPPQN